MRDAAIVAIEVAPNQRIGYVPDFFEREEADELLEAFLSMDMAPETIRMFGSDTIMRRRTAQDRCRYAYNASAKKPVPWTPLLSDIRKRVERVAGRPGCSLDPVVSGRRRRHWLASR